MKSRSESPSGVGFDDFAKFVHIFSSLVLTEIRLSFKFIPTFIRMKKNQSTFKIIFRPALSQGKFFHVENQRELVTMANLQTKKMYCLLVFFLDLVILLVPQHIPFEETVRYSPAKHPQIEVNWERKNVTVNRTRRKAHLFCNLQRSFGILGIMTSRRVAGGQ